MKNLGIILASGEGKRFDKKIPKQYYNIGNKTVLETTVDGFSRNNLIDGFFLVVKEDRKNQVEKMFHKESKCLGIIIGGETRQQSVINALKYIKDNINDEKEHKIENYNILVHDGVRPFVTDEIIKNIVENIDETGAVIPAVEVVDTIKTVEKVDDNSRKKEVVLETLNRDKLRAVQTPQGFKFKILEEAYDFVTKNNIQVTDDASAVESIGVKVRVVDGSYKNVKITTKADLPDDRKAMQMDFRVGTGYDVHRLVEGRKLILGGVEVPFEKGLDGHSDADVLTHSIMDSLLGACGGGDIGCHFPDTDEKYKGINSLELLEQVGDYLEKTGFSVNNIDCTIIAEKPKMKPYIEDMKKNIAQVLKIRDNRVNIKATTTEKLGFEGRKEGISAQAVSLVYKK